MAKEDMTWIKTKYPETKGQAMVEFSMILVIVMTICAGILYANRLVTFDFWAQQEARYLAFEQVLDRTEGDPLEDIEDGESFRRPSTVGKIQPEREVDDDGGLSELFAFQDRKAVPEKNDGRFTLLRSAVASQLMKTDKWKSGGLVSVQDPVPKKPLPTDLKNSEGPITSLLHRGEFGEKFCEAMTTTLEHYGVTASQSPFGAAVGAVGCAARYEREFAQHLAQNVDVVEVFRDYESQLVWGLEAGEALQVTLEKEVAAQFYSFFDTTVKVVFEDLSEILVAGIEVDHLTAFGVLTDDSFQRMGSDLRYVGSAVAMFSIGSQLPRVVFGDIAGRDREAEKEFEEDVFQVLHEERDAEITDASYLVNSVTYAPLLPSFDLMFSDMFNGVMRNVLAGEVDNVFGGGGGEDQVDKLIRNTNKQATVRYTAEAGLFPAARRRWKTDDQVLTSRFYLITQPWQIERRESPDGDFREKGTEFEGMDEESEEAMLRRRVFGLWFVPSCPLDLLSPLIPFIGAPDLNTDTNGGCAIGNAKSVFFNSPIGEIGDAIESVPGLMSVVDVTPPELPAVRPDAYPDSVEMENDKLMGRSREFSDYVEEQLEFNPEPDPKFNDTIQ